MARRRPVSGYLSSMSAKPPITAVPADIVLGCKVPIATFDVHLDSPDVRHSLTCSPLLWNDVLVEYAPPWPAPEMLALIAGEAMPWAI